MHEHFELDDGSVHVWMEQGAIHIIAVERPYRDPVELTSHQALQLADALRAMARAFDERT